ncbi:hypothetical protein ACKUT9_10625 [Mycobacterium seoulense]|uniref:Uncharacterized protein n=1 Tax=Mycobacterium seoulense TaxID=386911 RepID=A0A7I7P8J8_9MYCO|nr:hypothetical protein [Mycobacterium seoulense]MCV7439514.1 hypothetical protein [Mycobacterium seoulense]BBY04582.1 hypothetical protein MSEO_50810 [Mycobacterium seoulense]
MEGPETTGTVRTRRLRRVAMMAAGIALAVVVVLAVSIYVGVFVILSPMMG